MWGLLHFERTYTRGECVHILEMTIHSDWLKIFKGEAPHAFKDSYPLQGTPKVAYIDGMPLLMACEQNVQTWDDLLRCNFARHVKRYFHLLLFRFLSLSSMLPKDLV